MSVMKLVNGATEIVFDPDFGYKIPDINKVEHHRTGSGKLFSFKFYFKKKWTIPLRGLPKSDADQINTWWENIDAIEFYPDLIYNAATKYNITIVSRTRPLDSYFGLHWEVYFNGKLELEEH